MRQVTPYLEIHSTAKKAEDGQEDPKNLIFSLPYKKTRNLMVRHRTFRTWLGLLSVSLLWTLPLRAQQEEYRPLTDFDQIEFIGRGDIYLYPGNKPSLRVEVSEEIPLERIRTRVQGRTLFIEYERDDDDWLNLAPSLTLHINYPTLRALKITGLAHVESSEVIRTDRLVVAAEGMGRINLSLEVASLEVTSAGTTNMNLSGTATAVRILNDGTGTIDAFELLSQEADVEVNGTGLIRVHSVNRLKAEANGLGATVKYRGDPKKTEFDKSGFASIKSED